MVQTADVNLKIELPQRKWDSLNMNTSSGSVDLAQWKGNKVNVKIASGDMEMKNIEANEIALKTGSGNIVANQYKAKTFTFDTRCGTVKGRGDVIVNVAKKPNSLAVDFQAGSGEGQIEWDVEYE